MKLIFAKTIAAFSVSLFSGLVLSQEILEPTTEKQLETINFPTEITCSQMDTAKGEKWTFAIIQNPDGPGKQFLLTISVEDYSQLVAVQDAVPVVIDGVTTYSMDKGSIVAQIENDAVGSFKVLAGSPDEMSGENMACATNSTITFNDTAFGMD